MFQSLLSQDNINHLYLNSDISIPLDVKGFQGLRLQNITPFYFNVTDSNGVIILYIEPWQKIETEISLDKITYTFNSMCNNRPQVQNNSAPSSTWAIIYELTQQPLDSKSEAITISNASNVNINGTVGVNLEGTNSVNIGTLPTVDLNNQTQVGINNAVQTLTLVDLGSTNINISELANGQSQTAMISGLATGYFKTLILEGTSKNGYTYTATASAFNRSSNVGTPTLTQSNGTNGEFYASGSLANDQAFSNVQVSLQANVSSPSTIFQDPITALTNWKVDSGSATAGVSGTTFGLNGTVIEETSQTGLVPQNLTLQGQFAVQNTQVTNNANSNVGQIVQSNNAQFSQTTTSTETAPYTYGSSFTVSQQIPLTGLGVYLASGTYNATVYLWDNNGNLLASGNISQTNTGASVWASCTFQNPVTLNPSTTYWVGVSYSASVTITLTTNSSLTTNGCIFNWTCGVLQTTTAGAFVKNGTTAWSADHVCFEFIFNSYAPYDTSGNGGRKIVALSNGWLVAGGFANNYINLFVSKDNGNSWNPLCQVNINATAGWAIASYGTKVYVLGCYASGAAALFASLDATTATGIINSTANVDSGQTSFGSGCSLAVDSSGNLYAVWCSKNSSLGISFNIRYSKSTNGGSTWSTVTQVTNSNSSGTYNQNPCIVSDGTHVYLFHEIYNGTNYYIVGYPSLNFIGTSQYIIYSAGTYLQQNTTACIDTTGKIHVSWQGEDSTYASATQIKYANSTNGGSTWSTIINVPVVNTNYSNTVPSITVDQTNKLYILYYYQNGASIYQTTSANGGTSWSASTSVSAGSNPQTLYPTTLNFSSPLVIFMNGNTNETQFLGAWVVGSHSTVSTHYRQDANDYYKVEWNAGQLNLIKVSGGTASTLASSTVNETATSVTLSLVVANNGNLTATLKGANTTQITATDTSITSGVLALGGDQNVVASNAFISGNYVPSDVVTVKAYAVA